jgi:L-amino acid N-acyltransferase YncA
VSIPRFGWARSKDGVAVDYSIRLVNAHDWHAVTDVFNQFVDLSMAAYPEERVGSEFFASKHRVAPDYPFLVVEAAARVVGFAYLSPVHPVATMRRSAQLTYFILPEHTGKGLGERLLDLLLDRGREMGVDNFMAHISSLNEGSIRFHRRHGFSECGRFRRVGSKHGRDFDMVWMQRLE